MLDAAERMAAANGMSASEYITAKELLATGLWTRGMIHRYLGGGSQFLTVSVREIEAQVLFQRAALRSRCLPTRHLPEPIRHAIKAAKMRPVVKACWWNSYRLVTRQDVLPLLYCEGIAISKRFGGHVYPHAWVRTQDGADIDITVVGSVEPRATEYRATLVLSAAEARERHAEGAGLPVDETAIEQAEEEAMAALRSDGEPAGE